MTRRPIVILAVAVLVLGVGAWQGPKVWVLATTQQKWQLTVDSKGGRSVVVGSIQFKRGDKKRTPLRERSWHVRSGFLHSEQTHECTTYWYSYGRVLGQQLNRSGDPQVYKRVSAPPWHFGVTDRRAPDAPWIERRLSFEEWWDSIPEGDKLRTKRLPYMPR